MKKTDCEPNKNCIYAYLEGWINKKEVISFTFYMHDHKQFQIFHINEILWHCYLLQDLLFLTDSKVRGQLVFSLVGTWQSKKNYL